MTERSLDEELKTHFGYNGFRAHQKEIVEAVMAKRDTLAILPTGAGKSLCYQLPALLMQGCAIVISPLISLMQDQVMQLSKSGYPAVFINSSLRPQDVQEVMEELDQYKLAYVAPERFADQQFVARLQAMNISFFVVDEAHCISQWGHVFRPEYRKLNALKTLFPETPTLAVTATATHDVEKDIAEQLGMKNPFVIKASFDRPNLMIRIAQKVDAESQMKACIERHQGEPGIIYAAKRKTVDAVYESLKASGMKVGRYHAGLSDEERAQAHSDFLYDRVDVMVATVAFGMGIHKPNVRYIIHHDMPQTIEQYYQEIGRAGRDGLPAECLTLFGSEDLDIIQFFISQLEDTKVMQVMEQKMWKMYRLCGSPNCRRQELLHYFGESYTSHDCKNCDSCLDGFLLVDETITAQKILSCVARVQQRFGIKYVVDILRGKTNQNILRNGHETLSTYGIMKECSEKDLRSYVDSLLQQEYLTKSLGEYPLLQFTARSKAVLQGQERVFFRAQKAKEVKEKPALHKHVVDSASYNQALFETLRKLRLEFAQTLALPAFTVFSDRTLIEMATFIPTTKDAFMKINGVGPKKWEQFGEQFLQMIQTFQSTNVN